MANKSRDLEHSFLPALRRAAEEITRNLPT